jgi:hypothetical protein
VQDIGAAFHLVLSGDPAMLAIVGLSLRVSLTAVLIGAVIGLPLGALLAVTRFPGRKAVIVALNALMGLPPVLVGLPHMKAGRLKAIASGAPKRSAAVPDVPTVAEAGGLAGFDVSGWWGLLGPAKLPRPIVDLLNASVRRILDDADVRRNLLAQGMDPSPSTPEAFAALIRDDMAVWGDLGRKLGIKLD